MHIPGCSLDDTGDGRAALQKIKTARPDLAFVDIRAGAMNGLEIARKMKDVHPAMIVCLLTDGDLPEYKKSALASGIDHCLAKDSLSGVVLLDFIRSALPGKGNRIKSKPARKNGLKAIARTALALTG